MWKGANNNRTGYSSNHGVAEPAIFRREMTIFAPKFGGYDQVDGGQCDLYLSREGCSLNHQGVNIECNESVASSGFGGKKCWWEVFCEVLMNVDGCSCLGSCCACDRCSLLLENNRVPKRAQAWPKLFKNVSNEAWYCNKRHWS